MCVEYSSAVWYALRSSSTTAAAVSGANKLRVSGTEDKISAPSPALPQLR